MKAARIEDMVKGWFVGNFKPSVHETTEFEVAIQEFKAGARPAWHFHKIATEITVIVSGKVQINGVLFPAGSIVVLEPNEPSEFIALEDTITTVVKVPSLIGDKYTEPEGTTR